MGGSQLTIDGAQILNDNEVDSERIHSGKASLSVGLHNISLEFSDERNGAGVMFSLRGPDLFSQSMILPSFSSWHDASNASSAFTRETCPSLLNFGSDDANHFTPVPMVAESGSSMAMSIVLVLAALSLKSWSLRALQRLQ